MFLRYTNTGRYLYAVGNSPVSASVTGIKSSRVQMLSYIIMGAICGLAGLLWICKYGNAQSESCAGYEMSIIAAVVVGGCAISGGQGTVAGVVLGAIFIGTLNNILPLIQVTTYWQTLIRGFVILFSVVINAISQKSVKRCAEKEGHIMGENKIRSISLDDGRSFKKAFLRWEWMLVLLLIAVNVMNIAISPNYLNTKNLASTMKIFLDKGIVAITMTMVLLLGEIDISVGSMMALSGTIMGLVGNAGGNFLEVALAGLLTGTLCGFFNGFLITRFTELSSTIITLANQIFFRGIALVILENRAYAEFPAGVKFMSWGSVFNVPFILVFFLLEVIGITYLVHFTTFGRSLFAMGRNIKASYYSGVKTDQIKIAVFTMNGMAASISSLFLISKLASARANMAKNYDMDIIAMVILGGVSVSGGKGSVIGTAIAVFIIGLLRYGLGLINVSSETLMIIVGCLLIVLVAIPNLKTLGNEFPHLAKLFARKKQRKA